MNLQNKSRSLRIFYLTAIFFILLSGNQSTVAAEKIIALTEQYYPWNYTENQEDDGEILGYATELVTAILEQAGFEYEIHIVPWSRAMSRIDSTENIIVFSMMRTREREDKYYWIGEIQHVSYSLYGLSSKADKLPRTIQAARHLRIGVTKGDAVHLGLKKQQFNDLIELATNTHFLAMLKRGRLDLIPYDNSTFSLFAQRAGFLPKDFTAAVALDDKSTSVYFALSKHSKPQVANRLRTAYDYIRATGTFDMIMERLPQIQKIDN